MNVFKRGRKAKEQTQNDGWDALIGSDSPTKIIKQSRSAKRKNKHYVDDEKPTLDLSTALPDTNDFRTSLLMPGLSARFSMLREQDDPYSKIGKASDDSVLFPKRASRMNLFQHNFALADIAEVESIYSSVHPPFADKERSSSFGADGYDSDTGSVMSRARPGEGNNIFGGRQKMYKLPTASSRNLDDGELTTSSRHVYEHDVALSQFQQYRARERERWQAIQDNRNSQATESEDNDAVQSPATAFSKNRGTQSSTHSGSSNLRASTAATSVVSVSPAMRDSEYMSGPALGSPKATEATFQRTPSSHRQKLRDDSLYAPHQLSPTKSAGNMRERFQRSGAIFTNSPFRNMTVPIPTNNTQTLDFGFVDNKVQSPTQSPVTQADDMLAQSLQPNDRGKATALGLFNRPAKEFDEQQYLQRQLQMHEGRSSPFSNGSRSESAASIARPDSKANERASTPQLPPIPDQASPTIPNSPKTIRASGGRGTPPPRQRSRSKSSASAVAKDSVKARVESLIRRQNAELAALEAEKLGQLAQQQASEDAVPQHVEDEAVFDDDHDVKQVMKAPSPPPIKDVHPAFRSEVQPPTFDIPVEPITLETAIQDKLPSPTIEINTAPFDIQPGLGLSGLIRTHLRHDSDKSSFMQPSPTVPGFESEDVRHSIAPTDDGYEAIESDARSFLAVEAPEDDRAPSPNTVMSDKAQKMLAHALAMRDAAMNKKAQRELEEQQSERDPSHRRGESSETTKERREFDEELAERRKRIQEGLNRVSENPRSTSPAATRGRDLRMEAFAQYDDSQPTDHQIKSMRRHGMELTNGLMPHPQLESRLADEQRGRSVSSRTNYDSSPAANSSPIESRKASYTTQGTSPQSRSTTPLSARSRTRERANSTTEHRSKSRTKQLQERPAMPGSFPSQSSFASQPSSPMIRDNESPIDFRPIDRSLSATSHRPKYLVSGVSEINTNYHNRISPRPSPIIPISPYMMSNDYKRSFTQPISGSGRTTPTYGRNAATGGRKMSVTTRTQISEPTLISSTSAVPLISRGDAPPLPLINPRRRGESASEKYFPPVPPNLILPSVRTPLETVPASPLFPEPGYMQQQQQQQQHHSTADLPTPATLSNTLYRPKNRLRKASSEGGNLAAKARYQALMSDLDQEREHSPKTSTFPHRAATPLGLDSVTNVDYAMF